MTTRTKPLPKDLAERAYLLWRSIASWAEEGVMQENPQVRITAYTQDVDAPIQGYNVTGLILRNEILRLWHLSPSSQAIDTVISGARKHLKDAHALINIVPARRNPEGGIDFVAASWPTDAKYQPALKPVRATVTPIKPDIAPVVDESSMEGKGDSVLDQTIDQRPESTTNDSELLVDAPVEIPDLLVHIQNSVFRIDSAYAEEIKKLKEDNATLRAQLDKIRSITNDEREGQ